MNDAADGNGAGPIILASRSPRRRALLASAVPADRLRVLPPADPAEESLEHLTAWSEIEPAMRRIAAAKRDAVLARIAAGHPAESADGTPDPAPLAGRWAAVVAADTAVIAGDADAGGPLTVLGQPPADGWEDAVRRWFRDHYAGRTHVTATAVAVAARDPRGDPPRTAGVLVKTAVTTRADAGRYLPRLIAAGEPPGRTGGVAIAGLFGALLVDRVEGGLSNVSGLPLRETLDLLCGLGVDV